MRPRLLQKKFGTVPILRARLRKSGTVPIFCGALVLVTLLLPIKSLEADYVYLNDGSVISGVLMEESTKLFVYRVPYGEMFINRENIKKIIQESKDKPLLREAEKYLKGRDFKRAIKTCGEALEINPANSDALEFKQEAINSWQKYEAEKEERIRRQREERERLAKELEKVETSLKDKWGIGIKKGKNNYIIADVYYNCPLTKGEIKPGDILVAVQDTEIAKLPIKKAYDLLLTLKKINLAIQRPVVLTREKILWRGTKEYVGLGISIEKVDKGIKITNLMPNGPGAKAGLLKNDILTSLDNRSIKSSSMDEIIKILKGSAETKLKAVIERNVTFQK